MLQDGSEQCMARLGISDSRGCSVFPDLVNRISSDFTIIPSKLKKKSGRILFYIILLFYFHII